MPMPVSETEMMNAPLSVRAATMTLPPDGENFMAFDSRLSTTRRVSAGFPFRNAVLPVLQRLVAETGESAHFALLDGNGVVFVANVLPPKPVASVVPEGLALPWEDTALGVALVSALPNEERVRLLAANGSSAEHVVRAAQDGFALIRRHETRRIFELAVPVQSEWRTVIGAIGMTGPAMRFSEDKLPDQIAAVQRAAQEAFEPEGLSHARDGG